MLTDKELMQTGYDRILMLTRRYSWIKRISLDIRRDFNVPFWFIIYTNADFHYAFRNIKDLEVFIFTQEILRRKYNA